MYQGIRQGKLNDLISQLEKEQTLKRDMIVPAEAMKMSEGNLFIKDLPEDLFSSAELDSLLDDFGIEASEEYSEIQFNPTEVAEHQVAKKLSIPTRFYRYLKSDHIDILDDNVTRLLNRADKNYFIRTFAPNEDIGGGIDTGMLRAFLSDRYKVVDHLHIIDAVLTSIKSMGANLEIGHCNLTEQSMYVEFVNPQGKITAEDYLNKYQSPSGDDDPFIYSGFVISNSETGKGSYQVVPRAIVGACQNGMLFKRDAMRRTHLGSKMDEGIRWSQETLNKEVELIESQIQDAVKAFTDTDYIERKFKEISEYNDRLEHPVDAVENVCSELSITKEERQDVMNYFIDGGDFSPVGVTQAVTYHAHQQEDADKQYDLEAESMDILGESFYKRFDKPSDN